MNLIEIILGLFGFAVFYFFLVIVLSFGGY